MRFLHSPEIWRDFPDLVAGVVMASGLSKDGRTDEATAGLEAAARSRLSQDSEGTFSEIRAWRRAFAAMGLKPTRYRCASEALLRRLRQDGRLPRLHPMVDLCNAASAAFAIPVALFDLDRISGDLVVRYARGDEQHVTPGGEVEHPDPGEIVFTDESGIAHSRRWTNRQGSHALMTAGTSAALIVAEALHESAATDIPALIHRIAEEVKGSFSVAPEVKILTRDSPVFAVPVP